MARDDRTGAWSSPVHQARATCQRCGAHLTAIVVNGEPVGECSTCGFTLATVIPGAPLIESSPERAPAATRLAGAPPRPAPHPATVVVVDDHPLICQAVEGTLREAGHQITGVAADGRAGLEMVRARRPDVAIVDLELPVMPGLEVISAIAAEGLPTRTIVYTAGGGGTDLAAAVELADGAVSKRADARDLVDAVEAVKAGRDYVHPTVVGLLI